jgi:hypothetical protein
LQRRESGRLEFPNADGRSREHVFDVSDRIRTWLPVSYRDRVPDLFSDSQRLCHHRPTSSEFRLFEVETSDFEFSTQRLSRAVNWSETAHEPFVHLGIAHAHDGSIGSTPEGAEGAAGSAST